MVISLGSFSLLLLLTWLPELTASRPNIVVVLADDLGWGDVGWNNEAMVDVTRSLTRLAREGVRLSQYYVQQVCTPSRSALLTGMYPYHIGRQKRALKGGFHRVTCLTLSSFFWEISPGGMTLSFVQ